MLLWHLTHICSIILTIELFSQHSVFQPKIIKHYRLCREIDYIVLLQHPIHMISIFPVQFCVLCGLLYILLSISILFFFLNHRCLGFWSPLVYNWNIVLSFPLTICYSEQHCWIHSQLSFQSLSISFSLFPYIFFLTLPPPFPPASSCCSSFSFEVIIK